MNSMKTYRLVKKNLKTQQVVACLGKELTEQAALDLILAVYNLECRRNYLHVQSIDYGSLPFFIETGYHDHIKFVFQVEAEQKDIINTDLMQTYIFLN